MKIRHNINIQRKQKSLITKIKVKNLFTFPTLPVTQNVKDTNKQTYLEQYTRSLDLCTNYINFLPTNQTIE
jgi:ABC-type enterochelin transport system ATPase subunit